MSHVAGPAYGRVSADVVARHKINALIILDNM